MKIIENASLTSYNSFHLESTSKLLVILESPEDIPLAFHSANFHQEPYFILGGGSNTLFTSDFPGTLFHLSDSQIEHQEKGDYIELVAWAGTSWNDLVQYCMRNDLGGLENLSLIPGTVGAAPVQNIGAYGVELKDSFFGLEAYHINKKEWEWFNLEKCEFGYRNSVFKNQFKGQFIISRVHFRFPKKHTLNTSYGAIQQELNREGNYKPTIQDISRVVSKIRQEKLPDPGTIGNAGSFFKNPVVSSSTLERIQREYPDIVHYPYLGEFKLAAGWMIEKSGWKGKSIGSVGTWKNQALVIVNLGGAKGQEILSFAEEIVKTVYAQFQVRLEMEVNIL